MASREFQHFIEILATFRHAMLTTYQSAASLRARPMRIASSTDSGHLWFITSIKSDKLKDITEHPFVCASLQDAQHFVSISGTVRVTREAGKLRELWSVRDRAWFEKGIDDPELVALELVPNCVELWDRSGASGLKLLLEETRAIVGSSTEPTAAGAHEIIDFEDE